MERLQNNDGSEFWGLADAYYSAVWASEYESRKTAFGSAFFMTERKQSVSEFKSYSGRFYEKTSLNFWNTLYPRIILPEIIAHVKFKTAINALITY